MLDHAFRAIRYQDIGIYRMRSSKQEFAAELASHPSPVGRRRAGLALTIADGMSGSPGESVSRVGIHILGLPSPELQHEFVDAEGSMFVDFWWPQLGLAGEFDGYGKYLREELRGGRTIAEVLIAEKRREDRLRRLGLTVVRWDWAVAMSLPLLDARLRGAGLR
jgi:hypothetical protein